MKGAAWTDSAPLAERQQRLLARSAALRAGLGADLSALQAPLALADQARDAVGWLKRHRELLIAGAALIALLRPRRTLRWAARGWGLWRVARRLQPWLMVAWRLVNQGGATSAAAPPRR